MTAYHTEALALRTYPYSEAHKIAVFLTRKFGKVRGVAYGAQKTKSKFGASLEPLTYSRLTFSRKEHQELATIQNCEIIQVFPVFELSWELNLYFNYFAELLFEFSKEQEEAELFFRLTLSVLETAADVPIEQLARYFELWLLQLEGILPGLDSKLPASLAGKAHEMMRLPPGRLGQISLSDQENERLGKLCAELIEYHLEKRLRTRKFLTDI